MQTDIFTLLELEGRELQKSKNILVTESLTSGNFLLNFYVAAYLKSGYRVCFVGLGQSLVHYGSIASKLGVNWSEAQNAGNLTFIDGLAFVLDTISGGQHGTSSPFSDKSKDGFPDPWLLWRHVLDALQKPPASASTVLIFDDVNALLDIGYQYKDLADFLQYTANLRDSSRLPLTTVWMLHASDQIDDQELNYIKAVLKLKCDILVQLNGLKTGFSSDVHGEMEVTFTTALRDPSIRKTKRVMQYKVTDRTVSLFARGTSAAVL